MIPKVPVIKKDELEKLHTGTLMSRRAALLKCEETFESSDRFGYESKPKITETGIIEFKNTPEWKQAYSELKEILKTHEHFPNKQERKAMRQAKARG